MGTEDTGLKELPVLHVFRHALRVHEVLGGTDALGGFSQVGNSLFEDGVFVGHASKCTRGP